MSTAPVPLSRWHSALFVPGHRPEFVTKAARSGADMVILDLEDAVPLDLKVSARDQVRQAAAAIDGDIAVCVRVNPPTTALFADDIDSLPPEVAAVIVPKFEAPLDIGRPVIAGLETVRGVVDARDILGGTVGCYFGAEDYIADLGGVRTADNHEVHVARAMVAMAARVHELSAFDMVTVDFHDDERFRAEAAQARALGFTGKLCIHPAQVALANEGFRPSPEEIDRARRLLAAFDAAGGRAIAFEGQLVDEPVATQARRMVAE